MKLPVIFAGHGSPMIALEDNELTKEFQKIGERVVSEFEKPKAILSFSAHWFTRGTYVQSDPEPRPEKLSQTKESYHRNPGPTTQYQLSLQIYNTFCSRWRGAYLQSKG